MKNQDKVKIETAGKTVVISKQEPGQDPMSFKNLLERFYRMNAIPTSETVTRRQPFQKKD